MLTSPEEATALLDQAIALDPNYFNAWNWRGWTALVLGENDAAGYFESALRLSPAFPNRYWIHVGLAATYVLNERYDEAASLVSNVLRQHPHNHVALWVYTTALALGGRIDEATKACKTLTGVVPTMRLSNFQQWVATRDAKTLALVSKGLRLAGLPE
jgi:tetratricopeptide (TPR) repeat protein